MVPLTQLWLPILLAAVFVFIASSIIHMVLGYHRSDFRKLSAEDEVMAALRSFDIPSGDYLMPCPSGPQGMKSPEFQEKMKAGPVAMMTIRSSPPSLTTNLILWFLYCIVVGVFAAYIAGRALRSALITWTCFASLGRRRLWAMASHSCRTRSGKEPAGARRSEGCSTD